MPKNLTRSDNDILAIFTFHSEPIAWLMTGAGIPGLFFLGFLGCLCPVPQLSTRENDQEQRDDPKH